MVLSPSNEPTFDQLKRQAANIGPIPVGERATMDRAPGQVDLLGYRMNIDHMRFKTSEFVKLENHTRLETILFETWDATMSALKAFGSRKDSIYASGFEGEPGLIVLRVDAVEKQNLLPKIEKAFRFLQNGSKDRPYPGYDAYIEERKAKMKGLKAADSWLPIEIAHAQLLWNQWRDMIPKHETKVADQIAQAVANMDEFTIASFYSLPKSILPFQNKDVVKKLDTLHETYIRSLNGNAYDLFIREQNNYRGIENLVASAVAVICSEVGIGGIHLTDEDRNVTTSASALLASVDAYRNSQMITDKQKIASFVGA